MVATFGDPAWGDGWFPMVATEAPTPAVRIAAPKVATVNPCDAILFPPLEVVDHFHIAS